jgi:hypothetical protein
MANAVGDSCPQCPDEAAHAAFLQRTIEIRYHFSAASGWTLAHALDHCAHSPAAYIGKSLRPFKCSIGSSSPHLREQPFGEFSSFAVAAAYFASSSRPAAIAGTIEFVGKGVDSSRPSQAVADGQGHP